MKMVIIANVSININISLLYSKTKIEKNKQVEAQSKQGKYQRL